ncbi:HNH endonuclease signature motif containing protein [Anaeromyxobacter dehalogenans]|uniref:HNH endonuclease n=1 Tax=Anaeromyxobacter dehalogenans (strain 2CP-C) TaxID=290397 RepID=Q2IGP6_ANADE|nr:HNH endonuclease signature motif containing protein [Anaeromyxobacter dehalogenans]ABC83751.1 HNH endonuclease [Anaeromyxobacter dehalogenans 2CP-C]
MDTARELSDRLATLLRRERSALAEFLVALAGFDSRRAWAELGYASLFHYLHRELGLSKGSAQYRKVAAELLQAVPAVVGPLRDGRLCFTTVIEVARVVTAENWEAVLPRFYGLSRHEAAEIVAALVPHPAPPVRTVLTAVRAPVGSTVELTAPAVKFGSTVEPVVPRETAGSTVEPRVTTMTLAAPASSPRTADLTPLTADRQRLHVTVSERFARKLARLRDLRPGLSDDALLEAAVDLLLAKAEKRKSAHSDRPRGGVRPSRPDRVPTHVRREVWRRDGGCCQWRLANGEICGSTHALQLDHVVPRALGGESTAANLRVLCAAHNLEAARRVFGDAWMGRYTKGRPAPEGAPRSGGGA